LVNEIKKLRRNNGTSVQLSLEFIRVKSYTNETAGGVKVSLTDEELKEFEGKVNYKNTD
jgi:hypoxanthine phosphoribosyltransferase